MKKAFIIAPAYLGTGETVNAIVVAEQLREKKVECTFIASPYGANFVKDKHFDCFVYTVNKEKNIKIVKDMIKKENPDLIVVADYYLFYLSRELPAYMWVGFLEDMDVTTITFDSIGLGREFPSYSYVVIPELFPPPRHTIRYRVPPFVEAIIYPSPPFSDSGSAPDEHCGRLYTEDYTTLQHNKKKIREELGIQEDVKLVFHPVPKWSLSTLGATCPLYHSLMTDIIGLYLSWLDARIKVVCVNPSQQPLYTRGTIQVEEFEFLPFDLFMQYLFSSDLMITDNLLSATMGKAILNRIPVLLLGNSYSAKEVFSLDIEPDVLSLTREYVEKGARIPLLPFWTTFKESYATRDIQNTFMQEELFNAREVYQIMKDILTDVTTQQELRQRQDEYIQKIQALPSMADIVMSFL